MLVTVFLCLLGPIISAHVHRFGRNHIIAANFQEKQNVAGSPDDTMLTVQKVWRW